MNFHFVIASLEQADIDELVSIDFNQDYPYWERGGIMWAAPSYILLRKYREGFSIGNRPRTDAINIGHVTEWRWYGPHGGEYRVSIRADYRRLFDVDFEILQNRVALRHPRQAYLPYWPQPGLIARDPGRQKVENVSYAGTITNRNLASGLKREDAGRGWSGLKFHVTERERWHDMREVDVLVAIRDFSTEVFDEKPPSKLINAWHAGIPLVGGYDSAYSSIGTPGVDYIRVKSENELRVALERLRDDPQYYDSFVKAGRVKAREFTRERIEHQWLAVLDGPVREDWERCVQRGSGPRLMGLRNRWIDRLLENAAQLKTSVRSLIGRSP